MKENSRDQILQGIKKALDNNSVQNKNTSEITEPGSDFKSFNESLELKFAKELQKVDGKFVYCIDKGDFILNLQQIAEDEKWETVFCNNKQVQEILLAAEIPFTSSDEDFHQMEVAILGCEFLIAQSGSIMVSAAQPSGRRLHVYPPIQLIIGYTSQMVPEIKDAIQKFQDNYKNNAPSSFTLITGPSRTADIEKTLILGAHGPKELYVFLINDTDS